MAAHKIVFNALLAATLLYAFLRGGQPEKLAALGYASACIATFMLPFDPARTFHRVAWGTLLIDVAVLAIFIVLAATANRFWPIWLASIALLIVGVHLVKAYQPELLPSVYALALGKISYSLMALLALGIARHQRRLREHGSDRDWSVSWGAAM